MARLMRGLHVQAVIVCSCVYDPMGPWGLKPKGPKSHAHMNEQM